LQNLSAARFLQGNFLDALQHLSYDGVQLANVKVAQSYFSEPGTPSANPRRSCHPGRPAKATEKIVITIDAAM